MNEDIVVLIPVYDPNEEIMDNFVKKLSKSFKNIVFVNDGSGKHHDKFMNSIEKKYPMIKHYINFGKGRGLKNGINYILNNYKDARVIVTADCDGQHSVRDIKKVADAALENQDSLVLGVRDFDSKNVPTRSKFGNVITRNVLYTFVGSKVSDTQTGLRAASFDVAKNFLATEGERYEYETNVLIEAKEKDIPICEVIIDTIYINENETSHFNPVKDSIRVYKLFASFIIISLISYLIETIIISKCFSISDKLYIIPLFMFLAKFISCIIKIIFNNNVNLKYVFINYLVTTCILMSYKSIVLKVIIDFLMFIISLFLIKFKTEKFE